MESTTFRIGDRSDSSLPVCPHCEKPLSEINDFLGHYKLLSNMHVFACPHCNKVINIVITSK